MEHLFETLYFGNLLACANLLLRPHPIRTNTKPSSSSFTRVHCRYEAAERCSDWRQRVAAAVDALPDPASVVTLLGGWSMLA